MVFVNLSNQEKDAFFALLDEYFDSRPDLFRGAGGANLDTPANRAVAASAVQHAFASASSSGVSPSSVRWKKPSEPTDTSSSSATGAEDTSASSVGRVAAAAAAFQKSGAGPAFLRQGADAGKSAYGSVRNSTIGRAPAPPKIEEPEEDPRPDGEMAEVLYDYTPDDPSDLEIKEGERILIVDKPSDDWWMGEISGRRGLVPASYVKVY